MTGQEARDDEREALRDISGRRAILVQKAYFHADDMRRYDDTEDLVSTLVQMANLLIGDARKHPEPEVTERCSGCGSGRFVRIRIGGPDGMLRAQCVPCGRVRQPLAAWVPVGEGEQ